jgi:AcrR family transcriptional regulator
MSEAENSSRRSAILDAAFRTFVNYGFKRTTMADIAEAAGISRPALYLEFKSKTDIFRAEFVALLDQAMAQVDAAFVAEGSFSERLTQAALAGTIDALRGIVDTPHGAELFDVKQEIAEDLGLAWFSRMEASIVHGIAAAERNGEISLAATGMDAPTFARLVVSAIEGVKMRMTDCGAAEADIRRLVFLMTRPLFN